MRTSGLRSPRRASVRTSGRPARRLYLSPTQRTGTLRSGKQEPLHKNGFVSDRKPKASSSIWRNRNLNLFWFGEGISVTGSIATTVVLPLAAIAYFDAGPTLLGVMAASFWVPWLLIGLPAGAWVDQADPLVGARRAARASQQPDHRHRPDRGGRRPGHRRLARARIQRGWCAGDRRRELRGVIRVARIMRTPGRPSSADDERDPIGERIKDGIRLVWRDRYLRWFTLLGGLTNFAMNGFQAIFGAVARAARRPE